MLLLLVARGRAVVIVPPIEPIPTPIYGPLSTIPRWTEQQLAHARQAADAVISIARGNYATSASRPTQSADTAVSSPKEGSSTTNKIPRQT